MKFNFIYKYMKHSGYWNKEKCQEKCQEKSLTCKTRTEFQNDCGGAYMSALKNKWLDDICSHMIISRKPKGYWTYDKCKEESSKYKTRGDFQKNDNAAYKAVYRNGWLDEMCSHMIVKNRIF